MSFSSSSRCLPRAPDVVEVLLLTLVEIAEHALEQHLGEADDRIQRRAQLVGHAGEELRLVPAGHLQLGALLLELPEEPGVDDGERGLAGERLAARSQVSLRSRRGFVRRTTRAPTIRPSRSIGTATSDRQPAS